MPDEVGLGEVVRRLERLETRLEELMREFAVRVVSVDLYTRDQRELERRFGEMERDLMQEVEARKAALAEERRARENALAEERTARENGDRELAGRLDKAGTNWRQALYNGLLPALFFMVSIAVTVILARGR